MLGADEGDGYLGVLEAEMDGCRAEGVVEGDERDGLAAETETDLLPFCAERRVSGEWRSRGRGPRHGVTPNPRGERWGRRDSPGRLDVQIPAIASFPTPTM